MTLYSTNLEVSLRAELQRWLSRALDGVLALPATPRDRRWLDVDFSEAVASARRAIGAVRLYAAETKKFAGSQCLTSSTVAFAKHAAAMTAQLEEEVNRFEELVETYAH